MKKPEINRVVAIGLAIGLLSSSPVFAAENLQKEATADENVKPIAFDIALGAEMMAGDTTYSIGGPVTYNDGSSDQGYFPWSELEWPLDIWLARLSVGMDIGKSWHVNGIIKTNITDPSDQMIDQDWLTASNPGQLDVYSNSNISDFSALILDINVEWTFLQRQSWNLYGGLGLLSQNFEYDGQPIHQYSPSGQPGFEFYGDGSVGITYEITYTIPYLLIGTDFQITPDFTIKGSFSYSPIVNAEDEDHHLLRDRVAKGDMDGDAYMFNVSGTYDFLSSWFVEGGFSYTSISVDGDMDIYMSGYHVLTEREESESTQTSGYLTVGYRF